MASKPLAPELRIVLVGKTGTGKSASGNTIIGGKDFTEGKSSLSVTEKCSTMTRVLQSSQKLTMVDTPGLFHTSKDQKKIMREIVGFIEPTLPGPHVFLWVVKLGKFNNEDKKSMDIYQNIFPSAAKFTIVLFTHGRKAEDKGFIDRFIDNNKYLKDFIKWADGQYHVFDNALKGDDDQVLKLVEKINNIAQQEGFYQPKLMQQAEEAIEAIKNQPEEKPAVESKEGATILEQIIDKRLSTVIDQCPPVKKFLEILCELAEKMIEY